MQNPAEPIVENVTQTASTSENPAQAAGTADPTTEVAESFSNTIDELGSNFERFVNDPSVDNALAIFGPMLLSLGQAILVLVVIVVVTMFIARWAQKFTHKGLSKLKLESTVVKFLSRLAKYAIWIIAIPIAFEIFGIKTTSLAAVIGAGGIAIGLAMQGSLSNIAAGIMLLFLRPIKVGDIVELDDEMGTVDDVGIFYTRLYTFQRRLVYLPNSEVLSNKIENVTETEEYRVDVPIGVAYGTDLQKAMEVLNKVATDHGEKYKDRENDALLTEFGDSSINFVVRVWSKSDSFYKKRSDVVLAIDKALKDAEIEIPFPQRDLHVREPFSIRLLEKQGDGEEGSTDQRTHQDKQQRESERVGGGSKEKNSGGQPEKTNEDDGDADGDAR